VYIRELENQTKQEIDGIDNRATLNDKDLIKKLANMFTSFFDNFTKERIVLHASSITISFVIVLLNTVLLEFIVKSLVMFVYYILNFCYKNYNPLFT
jgi:hypothetical protein